MNTGDRNKNKVVALVTGSSSGIVKTKREITFRSSKA
jgi:hypothetical protein